MANGVRTEREEPASVRRQQIMAIAAALFASKGYSSTTVRDIAEEAGILSGSLYHHFTSKESIAREILLVFLNELVANYDAIIALGEDPATTVNKLVRASFEAIHEHPDSVALYQNEALFLRAQPGFEFLRDHSAKIEAVWLGQLRRGQDAGIFRRGLDLPVLHRFIRDALWFSVRWYRPGGRHTTDSLAESFLEVFGHGILAD